MHAHGAKTEALLRATLAAAWDCADPAESAAEFWAVLSAVVARRAGVRQTPGSTSTRAQRMGLAAKVKWRAGVGLCTLRVTAAAAVCPYCGAEFALAAGVDAGLLPAFAREHGACRRRYNAERRDA